MQNKINKKFFFQLVLKDQAGNVVSEQETNLDDFAQLLNDRNISNMSDDAELEYYLIKHPTLRIKKDSKDYWHQEYTSGKGIVPTFIFVEE